MKKRIAMKVLLAAHERKPVRRATWQRMCKRLGGEDWIRFVIQWSRSYDLHRTQ